MKNKFVKITLAATIVLALAFISSCFSDSGSKDGCIRRELGVKDNTLNYVATVCDATTGEVLSQISTSFGSCNKSDLYFDRTIRDITASCGVNEIPIINSISSSSKKSSSSSRACDIGGTIAVGTQTWMAKNLNCQIAGSKCYGNDPANCDKYGRLYNFETAKKACPTGWRLPTNADWDKLYRNADGTSGTESPYESETAGRVLKAQPFAALLGGSYSDGSFYDVGYYGAWWSATEYGSDYAYSRYVYGDDDVAYWYNKDYKSNLLSIRCMQNN